MHFVLFQYNCISLGFTIGAVAAILSGNDLVASVLYCLALNHKQVSLLHHCIGLFFICFITSTYFYMVYVVIHIWLLNLTQEEISFKFWVCLVILLNLLARFFLLQTTLSGRCFIHFLVLFLVLVLNWDVNWLDLVHYFSLVLVDSCNLFINLYILNFILNLLIGLYTH